MSEEEDPVLAAVRRAPRMSPEIAALCRALVNDTRSRKGAAVDKTMHMYTDDEEYVIAASVEDAHAVMREHGCHDVTNFRLYPDDKPFTFHDTEATTKTAGEWAAERGRGWFACANY